MPRIKSNNVKATLADHERRLLHLEEAIGSEARSSRVKPTAQASTGKPSLPKHILAFRGAGFFAQPRTADDVHKKLAPTYPCEEDGVYVTLSSVG